MWTWETKITFPFISNILHRALVVNMALQIQPFKNIVWLLTCLNVIRWTMKIQNRNVSSDRHKNFVWIPRSLPTPLQHIVKHVMVYQIISGHLLSKLYESRTSLYLYLHWQVSIMKSKNSGLFPRMMYWCPICFPIWALKVSFK